MTLENLPQGQDATVSALHIDGAMRRRLMDFGVIEGTKISCLRRGKSCSLYRVRGTVLALRRSETEHICVRLCE